MKKLVEYSIAAFILLLTAADSKIQAQQLKLVKQDRSISLYERWIITSNSERVRELTAIFTVRSDRGEIIKLLCDASRGTTWNNNVCKFSILHLDDQKKWITYIRYRVPWPFADQDCCLLYHVQNRITASDVTEVAFESTEHRNFPLLKDVIPIKGVKGKWILERQKDNTTRITYTVSSYRSTNLPQWISDPIVHDNLFKTMNAFKQIVEK